MYSKGKTIIFPSLAISLSHVCWCARWRRFKVTSRLRRRTKTEVWNHQSYTASIKLWVLVYLCNNMKQEPKFVFVYYTIAGTCFIYPTDGALVRVEQVAPEPGRLGALPGQCGSFILEMTHQESKCKRRQREKEMP